MPPTERKGDPRVPAETSCPAAGLRVFVVFTMRA